MRDPRTTTTLLLALLGACGDDTRENSASDSVATSITTAPVTTGSTGTGDTTSDIPTSSGTTGSPTSTAPGTTSGTQDSIDPTDTTTDATSTTSTTATTGAVSDGTTTGETTDGTIGATDSTTGADCGNLLDATVRDFSSDHPDFEKYSGAVKGLVLPDLGPDKKPVHAAPGATQVTSGPDAFKQWYTDVPGINQAFPIQLELTEVMPGIFQYTNKTFFPLDDKGFGNQGNNHNFHFTTEIHTEFAYNGGEIFTFTGDDDLWTFINGKLAIDLGGVHGELSESIDLDASAAMLGIVPGNNYTMDIFHAERHTTQSNFRIDTTIGCFVPIPG